MINLKEIICHPSPPPLPPHIHFKYCPLHSLHLICRLCSCCRRHCYQRSISFCRCPCPLFISVTVAVSIAFANAIVVAIALSSSTPVPIAIFLPSLYVAPTC
jgi:hypothetical protein